jgi:hypothetical protein
MMTMVTTYCASCGYPMKLEYNCDDGYPNIDDIKAAQYCYACDDDLWDPEPDYEDRNFGGDELTEAYEEYLDEQFRKLSTTEEQNVWLWVNSSQYEPPDTAEEYKADKAAELAELAEEDRDATCVFKSGKIKMPSAARKVSPWNPWAGHAPVV